MVSLKISLWCDQSAAHPSRKVRRMGHPCASRASEVKSPDHLYTWHTLCAIPLVVVTGLLGCIVVKRTLREVPFRSLPIATKDGLMGLLKNVDVSHLAPNIGVPAGNILFVDLLGGNLISKFSRILGARYQNPNASLWDVDWMRQFLKFNRREPHMKVGNDVFSYSSSRIEERHPIRFDFNCSYPRTLIQMELLNRRVQGLVTSLLRFTEGLLGDFLLDVARNSVES